MNLDREVEHTLLTELMWIVKAGVHKFRAIGRHGNYIYTVVSNICGSSEWGLVHVTRLQSWNFSSLRDILKICAPPALKFCKSTLLSNALRFPKQHCFIEGSHASPNCPSRKCSMQIKMCIEYWRNDIDRGKTEVLGDKHVLVPLCLSQISHGLISERTQASAMTGWRLNSSHGKAY